MAKLTAVAGLLILILISTYANFPIHGSLNKKCDEIRQKVSENRESAKSRLLSDCLYRHLKQKVANETGSKDSLSSDWPPPTPDSEAFSIKIWSVQIERVNTFQIPMTIQFIAIAGVAKVSWTDLRLRWNKFEWNLNKFVLNRAKKIWLPKIDSWSHPGGIIGTFQKIEVSYDGSINADMFIDLNSVCYELPGELVPAELMACCTKMSGVLKNHRVAEFTLDNSKSTVITLKRHLLTRLDDPTFVIGNTDALNLWKPLLSNKDTSELYFCSKVVLKSKAKIAQYVLPLFGVGMLLLAAQVFHTLKLQLGLKMLSLLLQFMCFERLLPIGEYPMIETVPIIYRAYWCTFCCTLISILITLFSMTLTTKDHDLSLPQWCQWLINLGSKYLAFLKTFGCSFSGESGEQVPGHVDHWKHFISTIHNILCLALDLIYCIVIISLLL